MFVTKWLQFEFVTKWLQFEVGVNILELLITYGEGEYSPFPEVFKNDSVEFTS